MQREVPAVVRHNADAKVTVKQDSCECNNCKRRYSRKNFKQSRYLNGTKELGDNSMSKMFLIVKKLKNKTVTGL